MTAAMPEIFDRSQVTYDALPDLSSPLNCPLGGRLYKAQFAPLYDFRLKVLRKKVLANAQIKWENEEGLRLFQQANNFGSSQGKGKERAGDSQGDGDAQMDVDESQAEEAGPTSSMSLLTEAHPKLVSRILDVQQGSICYIIGTVYCSMPLKPDVLEDLTREQWLPPQPVRTKYFDADKDDLFLEDESGRVRLTGLALQPFSKGGNNLRNQLVTGVVVGVLGTETKGGDFEVADLVFPEGSSRTQAKEDEQAREMHVDDEKGDKWIAFVSGLEVGADEQIADAEEGEGEGHNQLRPHSELKLLMLSEWLSGELGSDQDRDAASKIVSLVIAGNSLAKPLRSDEERRGTRKALAASKPLTEAPPPPKILDPYLSDIAASLRVHLMPGENDPAPTVLPQQPIHHALLPKSSRWSLLKRETNPAWLGLGGRKLLGTSGQNIDDIFKYMEEGYDSRLKMATQTLQWAHIAPTAPDTLWCFPFTDRDPFLISERPDVYFVGNQPRFGTTTYTPPTGKNAFPTRVVLIPKFSETGEIALVNLRTLECKSVKIDVDL